MLPYQFFCVCLLATVHAYGGQKMATEPLELELPMVVRHHMVLEIEPGSSSEAALVS